MTANTQHTNLDILTEQLRVLYQHFTFMSAANIPSVIAFAYLIYGDVHIAVIIAWATALLISIFLRIRLAREFSRINPKGEAILPWARQATASALLSGLLWALLVIMVMHASNIDFYMTTFFMCAMATIFLAPGSTYRPAFFAFSLPILLSVAITTMIHPAFHWFVGILWFTGTVILINLSGHYAKTFIESIHIRFENRTLIEQLTTQKREAENANTAKSRFLAAASHDLRQPLHALSLYLDTLRAETCSKRQTQLLSKISMAEDGLKALLERLLDLSKLDAGVVEPYISSCSLQEMFKRLEVRFTPLASAKKLKIEFCHNQLHVLSDSILLERILDNLISNAIYYTASGEIEINASKQQEQICIAIKDTGTGIPAEELENIFNEFYQLHNPERNRHKGLGLGLSIVKRLCALMQHTIIVASLTGNGSVFTLNLPSAKAQKKTSEIKIPPARPSWDLHGLQVLIIDDEKSVLDASKELLQGWGCQVATADSCESAVVVVKQGFIPELILADYRLRQSKTGVQAISLVEKILHQKIPAILITGDTAVERLKEATLSGHPILHKPIKASQLRIVVNHLLVEHQNSGRQLPPDPNVQLA